MPVNSEDSAASTASPSSQLGVDIRRFPWMRRLALDYVYDYGSVATFFAGNPADRAAWTRTIGRTQSRTRRGLEMGGVIAAQQRLRDAPPEAVEAGRALADPHAVAVVTGQQAGLFGGPLFTLLKAITALKLAERVARDHAVRTIAVFWVEAEDHDWDEVRSCTVLDETLAPRTVSLPPREAGRTDPISETVLDQTVVTALDGLAASLPATGFRGDLMSRLSEAYAPGRDMANAFATWLEQLLGHRGLVVYDCSDPAAKSLASEVFARELSTCGQTPRLAVRAGVDLRALGYHAQLQLSEDQAALFYLGSGRRPIRRVNGGLAIGNASESPSTDALVREARERPEHFSPNVLLRPIVQDTLFPTVCYVPGPNELAYLGQLGPVYEHFGVPMPLLHPRASATLVDSAALRFLTKYSVALESLQPQDEAALNDLLRRQIPPEVEEAFTSAGRALEAEMARLHEALAEIDPTLKGAAQSSLGRMQHDLQSLHGKAIQAAKRRDETLRRQFGRTRALAFPNGHAQEREVGFVSFLNQYGPALIERLHEALPLDLGHHWIMAV